MQKIFSLEGKNAVVVGGAGGIGQAIAQGLAEAGAKVAIASRSVDSLQRAVLEIKEACGLEVKYYTVDAAVESSVEALVVESVKDFGKVDILVNAQGFNKKFNAEDFPMDSFKQMFDVNVIGVMMCCKHFGKHMIQNGYGKMVNLSSVRGRIATKGPGNAGYCGTKGALDMMTRQLASEFGKYNITVNAIGPTITETPMMTDILNSRGPNARKDLAESLPMKRMALPTDCVGPAIFLCSDASGFVTGNIIYPDGGLTAIG
ncbi:2-dehydro-3-deoxy-D-gluconate 5-dehydrogenase [Sporomusa silvacetica DSM 10669]|uniref:2-dehydro-3-deoxy-D-gluconate 5-dehydrogenase n=1 Tax=Sporomusa silvacetica DSM 10669 TaxID=1123289 RepID=A0ABZ3ITI9_9FIRM|nr:SDR family oxidoreductase [Sporomusa silvacetica]OZC22321.1 gluconate 5-dehydrogenase [Sporomusa silvacetica DSM 10669]